MADEVISRRDEWKSLIDEREETLMGILDLVGGGGDDPELAGHARWLRDAYGSFFADLRRYVDFCEDRLEDEDARWRPERF